MVGSPTGMEGGNHLWEVGEHRVQQGDGGWNCYVAANQCQGVIVIGLQKLELSAERLEGGLPRRRSRVGSDICKRPVERGVFALE